MREADTKISPVESVLICLGFSCIGWAMLIYSFISLIDYIRNY